MTEEAGRIRLVFWRPETVEFLNRAREALGHRIEIIPGHEEARLIYGGVCRDFQNDEVARLVIDIGGGSTEIIRGRGREPDRMDSLYMGCVSYTSRYFRSGLTKASFGEAQLAALSELRPVARSYRTDGWDQAFGSSGTILAIDAILKANGWSTLDIDRRGMKILRRSIIEAGSIERIRITGLSPERARTIPGGLAILLGCFDGLRLQTLRPSTAALREGILTDMIGRMQHEDVRDLTVLGLCGRHQVDMAQAKRIERWAVVAFNECAPVWGLHRETDKKILRWACRLHEVGLSMSYAGHHKHGAYLITHTYMAGFSRQEKTLLSALISSHRQQIHPDRLNAVYDIPCDRLRGLVVLLRLAVCLHRSRSPKPLPEITFDSRPGGLGLAFPIGWLDDHPLSKRDLDNETQALRGLDFELDVT